MPIEFSHVFHLYSPKTPYEHLGLDDVSISFEGHSFVALVGHTGSGKSTLVQHMNGLLLPTSGKISFDGMEIVPEKKKNKKIKQIRSQIGLVFQFPEYQLFEETVIKDVAFGPKNFGMKEEEALQAAKEALLATGLDESYFERSPFELSGGEKRRVAIAGIIALKPKVLVLDEPTAGLDPQGAENMMKLFTKIHDMGTQIILVTHDMDLVLEHCDYVFVMKQGKIIREGSPLSIFSHEDYESLSLDYPQVYRFARKLMQQGLPLDITKIKNIADLAKEIRIAKEGKHG